MRVPEIGQSFYMIPKQEDPIDDGFTPLNPNPESPESPPHKVHQPPGLFHTLLSGINTYTGIGRGGGILSTKPVSLQHRNTVKKLTSTGEKLNTGCFLDCLNFILKRHENTPHLPLIKGLIESSSDLPMPSEILSDYTESATLKEDLIFIPYLLRRTHIVIITVDMKGRTVEYYDSQGTHPDSVMQTDLQKIKTDCFPGDPKARILDDFPCQQNDLHNCGVHVLYYIRQRLAGKSFYEITSEEFNSKKIEDLRIKLADLLP